MAYVGRSPRYGFLEGQTATFDGSTTTVTLQRNVSSTDAIDVYIDNVHQEPDVAYTLSDGGNSITFTGTPENGAVLYIRFHGISFDTTRAYRLENSDGGSTATLGDDDSFTLSLDGTTALSATSSGVTIANLTVTGTTTTVNSTDLNIGDNKITLNSDLPSDTAPTENAGIVVNRGSSPDVEFVWNESVGRWYSDKAIRTGSKFETLLSGSLPTISADTVGVFANSAASESAYISIIGNSGQYSGIYFGDENDEDAAYIRLQHSNNVLYTSQALNVNGNLTASGLRTNDIGKSVTNSPITLNAGNSSKALRVYYDMDVYNTISFTDSSWTAKGKIQTSSGSALDLSYRADAHYFRSFDAQDDYALIDSNGVDVKSGGLKVNGTTRIASNGDATFGTVNANLSGELIRLTNNYTPSGARWQLDAEGLADGQEFKIFWYNGTGYENRLAIGGGDDDFVQAYGDFIAPTGAFGGAVSNPNDDQKLEVRGAYAYASGATSLATSVTKAGVRFQGASDASTSLYFGGDTSAHQYIQVANYNGTGSANLRLQPWGGTTIIGGNTDIEGNIDVATSASAFNNNYNNSAHAVQVRCGNDSSSDSYAGVFVQRGAGSNKGSGVFISSANYTNGGNSDAAFLQMDAGSYSGANTRFIHAHDTSNGTRFQVLGNGNVYAAGSLDAYNMHTIRTTRTFQSTVNDYVEIGYLYTDSSGFNFSVSLSIDDSGNSIAKQYEFVGQYGQDHGDWVVARPFMDTGGYSGNDFELDLMHVQSEQRVYLRVRTTDYAAAGTINILINNRSLTNSSAFTAQTGTGSASAPTASSQQTLITQRNGYVGIRSSQPNVPLQVNGTGAANGVTLKLSDAASSSISNHIHIERSASSAYIGIRGDQTNDPLFIRRSGNNDILLRSDKTMAFGEPLDKGNALAGFHFIDRGWGQWGPTLNKRSIAMRVETYWEGNNSHARAIGDYGSGIGLQHLGGHSATHDSNLHAAIALRVWDTPARERSALIFGTNNDTSSDDGGLTERMAIAPDGKVTIGAAQGSSDAVNNLLRVRGGVTLWDGTLNKGYNEGAQLPQSAIVIPLGDGMNTQGASAGGGWANIGWAKTARSGERMHRQVSVRYERGSTASDNTASSTESAALYIEAGTSEAGGICIDEDSVNVYGSSDEGTTFRIIDKDSDFVTAEMVQGSWNWNVRGSVNGSASMSSISDQRLKKSFQTESNPSILDQYAGLQLKSYIRVDSYDYMKGNYEDQEELREVGLVAQELEQVFPDCVGTQPIVDPRGWDSVFEEIGEELTEIKNVNVNQLLYKTIQAVQALIAENNALKQRVSDLEA